jgi:inorganic triphosphatase YgiF
MTPKEIELTLEVPTASLSSLEKIAAAELEGRWRKLRKNGEALRKLDPRGRLRLRIQSKKLRYAGEFFASLFSGKKAKERRKALLARLESVQDCLGDLNLVVHEDLMRANAGLGRRIKRPHGGRKRAFAAGLLPGVEDARFDTVLAQASGACASLVKAKPFW